MIKDSQILAGVKAGVTGLPDSLDDFDAAATIDSIKILGLAGVAQAVVNSNVAARFIGAATFRDVMTANGGVTFGIAADRIASLTLIDGSTRQKFMNFDAPGSGMQVDNFVVRAI